MVQREATFLISRATEEFIGRLAEAAQRLAERERRTTVQAKDIGACVRARSRSHGCRGGETGFSGGGVATRLYR